jgi:hypothetical protein
MKATRAQNWAVEPQGKKYIMCCNRPVCYVCWTNIVLVYFQCFKWRWTHALCPLYKYPLFYRCSWGRAWSREFLVTRFSYISMRAALPNGMVLFSLTDGKSCSVYRSVFSCLVSTLNRVTGALPCLLTPDRIAPACTRKWLSVPLCYGWTGWFKLSSDRGW